MAVWQENLRRLLSQKEVLILHGNIRDTAYIKKDGTLVLGLTPLLREMGRDLNFQRAVFWGTFFDHERQGQPLAWSVERIEPLQGVGEPAVRTSASESREVLVLTRWLNEEVQDTTRKTLFVIYYIDKLTAYSSGGRYSNHEALLIYLIEKIIEDIADNNRLLLVALQDTMVPLEYYTQSPRAAVMEIPLPDKEERNLFFAKHLGPLDFKGEHIDFLANITEGLYVRDLENILGDVMKARGAVSPVGLRRSVNRYRLGSEEDPWAKLPLTDPPKGLIGSAEGWFKERVNG